MCLNSTRPEVVAFVSMLLSLFYSRNCGIGLGILCREKRVGGASIRYIDPQYLHVKAQAVTLAKWLRRKSQGIVEDLPFVK